MNPLRGASGGGGSGLRASWERRQQAAGLAAAVAQLPALARSKPAFFAAQLQPVLQALRQATAFSEDSSSDSEEESEEGEQGEAEPRGAASRRRRAPPQQALLLAEAAAHLRRLAGIDVHTGANTCLLLFLLLGMAAGGDRGDAAAEAEADGAGEDSADPPLLQLCATLGWQALLLEALPLMPSQQRRRLERGLVAAAAATADDSSARAQQQVLFWQQLVVHLAGSAHRQLQDCLLNGTSSGSRGGSGAVEQQAHLADAAALQQLLLVCPAAAAGPAAAASLERLQAAADVGMAEVMHSMQQLPEGQLHQRQEPAFQQLCQLRARLMLARAAAGGGGSGCARQAEWDARCLHLGRPSSSGGSATPPQVWREVLQMPPDVAAASRSVAAASCAGCPTRQQFLAACVASRCLLQADSWQHGTCCSSRSSSMGLDSCCRQTACTALPGVRFEPPPLPALQPPPVPQQASLSSGSLSSKGGAASGAASMVAAAAEAAAELASEPACLGPAQLALAALQLAGEQVASGTAAAGLPETVPVEVEAGMEVNWMLLLELASAAAADVVARRQQRQLLLQQLHGRQAWQARLRRALAADSGLQQRCRRELVAVANRLSADAGGGAEAAVVHGEERRRRTAAAVRALLPHALLCPAAVLERLVRAAVVQAGEQVGLLLDVLREMRPLAAYRHQQQQDDGGEDQPPLLLHLLAQLLAPRGGGQACAAALDTPGSKEAFLQLAAGLCGAARTKTRAGAAGGAAATAAGEAPLAGREEPLVSRAALLRHVAAPALQHQLLQQQQQQGSPATGLLLQLQLADLLLPQPAGAAAGEGTGEEQQQLRQLEPLLRALVDMQGRRIDRSPTALQAAGIDSLELAAGILQRCGTGGGSSASTYFQQQLPPASQQLQQLQQLRQRMLQLLAALLPCCTAAEADEVLQAALPGAIQAAMMPAAAAALRQQQGGAGAGAVLPGAHAAAVEAACRAARALALSPDQAPIAGEQQARLAGEAAGLAAAPAPPSAPRQVAVERTLQHLTRHSARLAAAALGAASPAPGAARPGTSPGVALTPAEGQALGLRCFRELCQLATAIQPAQYDCATLQAGLLQLAQQLLRPGPAGQPAEVSGGLLPVEQVRQQLAAAAAPLPAGRLRDIVLLGTQQQDLAQRVPG